MFFKRILTVTLISVSVIASSTGCSKLFNKTPPQNAIQSPNMGFETQCLSNVLPVMSRFVRGDAFEAEVSATWDCFGNALSVFEKKVKGSNQNEFAAREIASFFENYFLNDVKISDRMLAEVMHIKQIFVGGSEATISKKELLKLVTFAGQMKQITIHILPYMKVYAMNWGLTSSQDLNVSIQYFEDSNIAIQQAVKDLSDIIAQNNIDYKISNISVLFHEFENLYKEKWDWLVQFDKVLPLIEKLKGSIAGGEDSTIAANEWRRFSLLVSRGYVQYLRYYYMIQTAPDAAPQIGYFTSSIGDVFSYLGDMVQEKPSHVFTKAELVDILYTVNNLFPNLHFSEAFVSEVMKIKVLIFGGSSDVWIPEDFMTAARKTRILKSVFEKSWTYLHFYTFNWNVTSMPEDQAQKFYKDAETVLNDSAKTMGQLFTSSYDLQDLGHLMAEFDKVIEAGSDSWSAKMEKVIPLIVSYKKIILNDRTSIVNQDKWQPVLVFSSRVYMQALYYTYFVGQRSGLLSFGLLSLDNFADKMVGLISELITQRGGANPTITDNELIEFTQALRFAEILPSGISQTTLTNLVKAVTSKIIADPADRISGKNANGITVAHTKVILDEYHVWSNIQHAYEKIFYGSGNPELSSPELLALLKRMDQTPSVLEAEQLYDSAPPLVSDSSGRVLFPLAFKRYDFYASSRLNLYRALARKVLSSYSMELARITTYKGITVTEMNNFYADLKPLLVDLNMIAPANTNFANNRFLEANLFMPSGDGNDFMNLKEGTQIVTMIFSGLEVNSRIEKVLGDQCLVHSGRYKTEDMISVDCLIEFYRKNYSGAFETMPELVRYLSFQNPSTFHDFMYRMLKATGWTETNDKTAARADVTLLPHVIQYLESVVMRYDVTKDGMLNDSETDQAFPVYSGLIQKFSGTAAFVANKAAFLYMLKYGKVPCGIVDVWPILWKSIMGQPIGVAADRTILSNVFSSISDKVNNTPAGKCPLGSNFNLPPGWQQQGPTPPPQTPIEPPKN